MPNRTATANQNQEDAMTAESNRCKAAAGCNLAAQLNGLCEYHLDEKDAAEDTARIKTKNSRMQTGSGIYECKACGKQTRETGDGESSCELCRACHDDAGLENTHSDQHHRSPAVTLGRFDYPGQDGFEATCRLCQEDLVADTAAAYNEDVERRPGAIKAAAEVKEQADPAMAGQIAAARETNPTLVDALEASTMTTSDGGRLLEKYIDATDLVLWPRRIRPDAALDALITITLDARHAIHLVNTDPKALDQALQAIINALS